MKSAQKKISIKSLRDNTQLKGKVISNDLCDDLNIECLNITFSQFKRLGLKNAHIIKSNITQCSFEGVYARNAKFINVNFTGCEFSNCNFKNAQFFDCTFNYCEFYNCQMSYDNIKNCLPSEANLREELARNLKMNFLSLGEKTIADKFLRIELKARNERLIDIVKSQQDHFRAKYDAIDRIVSAVKYAYYRFFYFLTGNGYNVTMLLISYLVINASIAIMLFIGNTALDFQEVESPVNEFTSSLIITFSESIDFNYTKERPTDAFSLSLLFLTKLIGALYLGLLAATVYRKIAR